LKNIVIAGSRYFEDYNTAKKFITECIELENINEAITIITGGCRGADSLGEKYAADHTLNFKKIDADWKRFGKSAGPIRNKKLADEGDIIICFWDQKSRGTKSLIDCALQQNKTVYIMNIN